MDENTKMFIKVGKKALKGSGVLARVNEIALPRKSEADLNETFLAVGLLLAELSKLENNLALAFCQKFCDMMDSGETLDYGELGELYLEAQSLLN